MVTAQIKSKRLWIPSLILTFSIALIVFSKLSLNIIELKTQKHFVIQLIIYLSIVAPLFFLHSLEGWKKMKLHKKLLVASLSFLLFAVSFRVQVAYQFSILFVLSSLFYLFKERKIYKPNTFAILTVLYFLWNATSLIWSPNVSEGLMYLFMLSPLLFLSIVFCFIDISKVDFEIIAVLIVRFASIFIFLSLCSWVLQSNFLLSPLENALEFEKHFIGNFTSYNVVFAGLTTSTQAILL